MFLSLFGDVAFCQAFAMLKTPDMMAFYQACGYEVTDKGLGSNLKENADRLNQDQVRFNPHL